MKLLKSWRINTLNGDLLIEESDKPLTMSVAIWREGQIQRVFLTKEQWDAIGNLSNSYSVEGLSFTVPEEKPDET